MIITTDVLERNVKKYQNINFTSVQCRRQNQANGGKRGENKMTNKDFVTNRTILWIVRVICVNVLVV